MFLPKADARGVADGCASLHVAAIKLRKKVNRKTQETTDNRNSRFTMILAFRRSDGQSPPHEAALPPPRAHRERQLAMVVVVTLRPNHALLEVSRFHFILDPNPDLESPKEWIQVL